MALFKKKEKLTEEEKEELLDQQTKEVMSTYIPQRRARLIGKSILRLGKTRLFLLAAIIIVALLFILSFLQEKSGNFTINLDRLEMFRKGIAMSSDAEFIKPTARLIASPVIDATNIATEDLPEDIDDIDGDHNGRNYMAYTYYVRNAGKEDVAYSAILKINSASKGSDEAARVGIWKNGKRTIYARPAKDGEPEPGCENFISDKIVCQYDDDNFRVGDVDKYTVVIWLDGDDPECTDDIVGGGLEFVMTLAAATEDDTTLLQKFIQDIKDTITGNKAIGAAGTESPDYYKYQDVNWYTRRNQPGDEKYDSEHPATEAETE